MHKARIKSASILVFFALFVLSCSEEHSPAPGDEITPLSVNACVQGGTATRAGATPVTAEGAKIGVFRTADGGYTALYDVKYTCSSGSWSSVTPIYMDNRKGKIVAYYDPNGQVSFDESTTTTSSNMQAQVYNEAQLWYFDNTKTSVNNTNAQLTFHMKCAYARMILQIERDASYKSDCKITEVTLTSGSKFFNNLPMDIFTGVLNGSAITYNAATKPLLTNDGGFVTIASGTKNIDLLLPPQTITSGGLSVSLKIDGEVRSVTIPQASLSRLASGSQYTVPLKILSPATLTIDSSVTEQAWGAANNIGTVTDISGMQ